MNGVSMVVHMDAEGGFVLPEAVWQAAGILPGCQVEMRPCGDWIILRNRQPRCVFCHGEEWLTAFGGQQVCRACREEMHQQNRSEA